LDVTHRPGRKAGAVVVLSDGAVVLYLEKGGRSLLTWATDAAVLEGAASALRAASGPEGTAVITKANGRPLHESPHLVEALLSAGFVATPKGYRSPRAG
jgi:ATP-dependent Lhr-like helicase